MRWAVDGRRLLGGIVARESAMRYAVVNVTVGNSAAAVHGIGVTHKSTGLFFGAGEAQAGVPDMTEFLPAGHTEPRFAWNRRPEPE